MGWGSRTWLLVIAPVATILGVSGVAWILVRGLPGYPNSRAGDFWVGFWANFISSAVVTIAVGTVVTVAINTGRDRRDNRHLREGARHEADAFRDAVWNLSQREGMPHSRTGIDTIPTQIHAVAALIDGSALSRWEELLPDDPTWAEVRRFRGAYNCFVVAATRIETRISWVAQESGHFGLVDIDPHFPLALRYCIFRAAEFATIRAPALGHVDPSDLAAAKMVWGNIKADVAGAKAIQRYRAARNDLVGELMFLRGHLGMAPGRVQKPPGRDTDPGGAHGGGVPPA